MSNQKLKECDIVKFVIEDPSDWYSATKAGQLFCVKKVIKQVDDSCEYQCNNCQANRKRKYNLNLFNEWKGACCGGFVKATEREAFLYYTHGRDALIEETNG